MAAILTGYKAGIDNAYKGHADGGRDTSSGILLDENNATFAIPLDTDGKGPDEQRTNLKLGDVAVFTNTVNGKTYKSLGLATDFGKLPHGDIDVAKGALQKNLNLEFIETAEYVNGVKGAGDVSISKLASTGSWGLKNGTLVNTAINKVNERIKSGELVTDDDIQKALAEEIKNPENIQLAQEKDREVRIQSRGSYGTYDDVRGDRRPTGKPYADFLGEIFKQDPMMGMLLMIIGLFTGMISVEDIGQSLMGMFTGQGASAGYGNGATNSGVGVDSARYNGKGVLGGRVSGVDYELPRYAGQATAGQYFADSANKFRGIQEQGGQNCGPIVKWTMANAGMGEGPGSYWCAGFASKIYEGTGLYNYTASAINFAEQGMATGSYRQGTIAGIEVGDTVIYSRKGGNHVGIVTKVENGRITTVEGNSGDKVAEHTRTFEQMQAANFKGYVDISHREKALGLDIRKQLSERYAAQGAGLLVQPEETPVAPARNETVKPEDVKEPEETPDDIKPVVPSMQDMLNVPQAPKPTPLAPENTTAQNSAGAKKDGLTIVLDRGHGAMQPTLDTGAVSPDGKVNEIQVANIYQAELKKALEEKGYNVKLTSDTIDDRSKVYKEADEARYKRTEIAKELIGNDKGLYLSIHANALDGKDWQTKASGSEMFFAGHVPGSEGFAKSISGAIEKSGVDVTKVKNYGQGSEKNAGKGLRQFENATFPSALIEMGYLDNKKDYDYLANAENIKAQARAVAEGIDKYAKEHGLVAEKEQETKNENKTTAVKTPEEIAKEQALAAVSGMSTQIIDADKAKAERAEKDEKKKTDDVLASCQIDAEVKKNKDGYPPKPSVSKIDSKESAAALA